MGRDEQADPGALSPVEDQGSVGDWRLPTWMPHISGLAWLFIGLAMLSVVEQLGSFMPGDGWAFSFSSDVLFPAITRSLPIIIPAAALWRTDRPRPRSLLFGSIVVGIGALLASGLTEPWASVDPVFGGAGIWQAYGGLDNVLWVITLAFTFAGPVLLGNAVRGAHERTSTRRAMRAGIAIGGLTIGYFALRAAYPVDLYYRFVTDPSDRLEFYGVGALRGLEVPALIGWAYFAWAVMSANAGGGLRRAGWLMAKGAVMIQQGSVALVLVVIAIWFFVARSGESRLVADAVVWASGAIFFLTPVLLSGASVLLIAAFAAGLGNPKAVEFDAKRMELHPLPNPG